MRFYRFRSVDRLIGIGWEKEELQRQSIYFAHPDALNDPMEGYRDIYWQGDEIVWKNLFKHYLLCLLEILTSLFAYDLPISPEHIPVFWSESDLPKGIFNGVVTKFFSYNAITCYVKKISERSSPVYRDELLAYLTKIHPLAVETIWSNYEEYGLIPKREVESPDFIKTIEKLLADSYFENIEAISKQHDGEKQLRNFFEQSYFDSQSDLIRRNNGLLGDNWKNKNLAFVDFPEVFIKKLELHVYPEWYTACFMSECTNSSVWGHYGDSHTGVCLVFKAEKESNDFFINLIETPLEFRVDNFLKYIGSDKLTQEQRLALCNSINSLFKDNDLLTPDNLCSSNTDTSAITNKLLKAIEIQYPYESRKLSFLLKDIKAEMQHSFPLENCKDYLGDVHNWKWRLIQEQDNWSRKYKFDRIDYKKGFGQIDFFRSLGNLPIPTLNRIWYSDSKGKMSNCADNMYLSEDQWRQTYWDNFHRDITRKSKDWRFEKEYRLIMNRTGGGIDKEDRTLKYEFSSLEGLIFGINIKREDKLKIIKIIEDKCKETGRKDFKFYQAYYSHEKKCIEHSELRLFDS